MMKVLIACEESQAVCIAFRELGHEAYSCDLQECSGGHPEWHLQGDAHRIMWNGCHGRQWDLMIAHPPCTYLSRVGIRWMDRLGRIEKREEAIDFFRSLWTGPVSRICIENPVPMAYVTKQVGKWDQVIQPYYFGDPHMKTTCLWLKGLPKLNGLPEVAANRKAFKPKPIGYNARGCPQYFTDHVSKKDQAKIRSRTFPGVARRYGFTMGRRYTKPKQQISMTASLFLDPAANYIKVNYFPEEAIKFVQKCWK